MLVVSYRAPDTNTNNNNTLWCVNPTATSWMHVPTAQSAHVTHIYLWHMTHAPMSRVTHTYLVTGSSCLITRDTDLSSAPSLQLHASPWSSSHIYYLLSPPLSLSPCARDDCPGQLMAPASWWWPSAVLANINTGWDAVTPWLLQQFLHIHISWPHHRHHHQPLRLISSQLPPLSLVLSNDQTCKWLVKHH